MGIWEFDFVKQESLWSEETFCILGFTPEDRPVPFETMLQVVHPEDRKLVREAVAKAQTEHIDIMYRVMLPDGTLRFIRSRAMSDRESGTRIITGTVQDVTEMVRGNNEQKDSAHELNKIKERYQLITEHVQDVISYTSPDGVFQYLSPAVSAVIGYEPEELIGTHTMDLYHPDDLEHVRAVVANIFRDSAADRFTCRVRRKNGQYIWVETTIKLICNEQGEPMQIVGVGRDITEQKRAKEQLSHAVRIAGIGHWEWDLVNDQVIWSEQVYKILGVDLGERLTSTDIKEYVHPDDLDLIRQMVTDSLQDGKYYEGELRIVRRDGEIRHIYTQGEADFDPWGNPVTLMGTMRDITEWKDQDRLLFESKQRYKSLVKYNPDGVCSLDLHGRYVNVNKAFERIMGYSKEELLGTQSCKTVLFPEEVDRFKRLINISLRGRSLENVELALRKKDGTAVEVSVSTAPIVVRGEVVGLYVIIKDITEKKLNEQKIQQSEERYRRLVDSSLDAIGIFENEKWLFMNGTGLALFGAVQEDEIIGRSCYDFLHPDYHEDCKMRVQGMMAGQPFGVVEQEWFKLNGKTFHAEVVAIPLGERGVQIILRDITDRKQAEEAILQAEKLSAVGQLAAGIAHEIRNPLTALTGFTQLLQAKSGSAEKQYYEIMRGELNRIEVILSELLVLAKPQAVNYRMRKLDLILHEVTTLLKLQALMNNVLITTHIEKDVPMVECDPNQLKQVFVNIIKNAIEAMPDGGDILVSLKGDGDAVRIDFEDTGYGIPEDHISKMGEPFFSTKGGGTGLGFMVSRKIIESHHGFIDVESEVGKGTRIRITLPVPTYV